MKGDSRVLLLDVMETLVTEPFWEVLPRHFGLSLQELLQAKHPRAWIDFELGALDEVGYCRSFFADRRPVDRLALRACIRESYAWLDGVEPLLAELAEAQVPMYALSNYPVWYELIDQKLGLSRYVDGRFVSYKTGVRKPDPAAYLGAAQALGVEPAACVFVDDRPQNVRAAEAVGMVGVLRTPDCAALRAELARLGLI